MAPEGLWRTTETSVRIAGVIAEIRNKDLKSKAEKRYGNANPLRHINSSYQGLVGHALSMCNTCVAILRQHWNVLFDNYGTYCHGYVCVTIDGVRIGDSISLPLIHTTRKYK
jgi:hypothetical protein